MDQNLNQSTFFTDFNHSKILSTDQSLSQSIYKPPKYSSFLHRLKTNTKNKIIKYNLKDKKDSFTTQDIYNTTGLKVQSLIKIKQEMSHLRLNITTSQSISLPRKHLVSKTSYTPRKFSDSVHKLKKTSVRNLNLSCTKIYQIDSLESYQIQIKKKKTIHSSFSKRPQDKQIVYEQFYGNAKDSNLDRAMIAQQKYYNDFIWKVAFTNHHILQIKDKPRVYIGKGNNSKLIKSLMRNRWWWAIQKDQSKADFIWTQLKIASIYPNQKQAPIVDYEQFLEDKKIKIIIKKDPALQLMNAHQYQKYINYLKLNLKTQRKSQAAFKARRILSKTHIPLNVTKVTNHIQFSRMIGNKKALFYTMKQYYSLINKDYTQFLPLTFHIVSGFEDNQYSSFCRFYNQRKKNGESNIWIVKPGQLSNRGNGITVCNNLDQIKSIIKSKKKHYNGKTKTYIVQLYMSQPFLYKNRKFDIRHYIMVTSVNGIIKGYWYEEGYIRTTSSQFNLLNLNGLVHLTNDAVQKYGRDYGKYQKGNKISYDELQTYVNNKYGEEVYQFQQILKKMKQIATDVIRASYFNLDPKRRLHNFEIFGMDFMINSDWKPYLIQINTNPCFQLSSPLLSKLIPSMIQNALRIGLDPIFPPPPFPTNKKMNYLQNKFELIFDEQSQSQEIKMLYQGEKRVSDILEDIGSDDEAYQDNDQDDF